MNFDFLYVLFLYVYWLLALLRLKLNFCIIDFMSHSEELYTRWIKECYYIFLCLQSSEVGCYSFVGHFTTSVHISLTQELSVITASFLQIAKYFPTMTSIFCQGRIDSTSQSWCLWLAWEPESYFSLCQTKKKKKKSLSSNCKAYLFILLLT